MQWQELNKGVQFLAAWKTEWIAKDPHLTAIQTRGEKMLALPQLKKKPWNKFLFLL